MVYISSNVCVAAMTTAFTSAWLSSFSAVVASEIGDKTFFIAAILAMKQSRLKVFLGCFSALFCMNTLSATLGSMAPSLIPVFWTYVASIVLFAATGVLSLKDAIRPDEEASEIKEVEDACRQTSRSNGQTWTDGLPLLHPIIVKAFTLTFLAEWGDKSQLVTIGLGATQDVIGVALGGGLGHALCTSMAVVGGKKLAAYFDERLLSAVNGVLFVAFACLACAAGPPV